MRIKNTASNYGWISIGFHWLSAIAIIGLLISGIWMVGLSYYSPWYHPAPFWHKSIGVLLLFFLLARIVWRSINTTPSADPKVSAIENQLAHIAHLIIYVVVIVICVSGYLITTADGRSLSVLDWFNLPALITGIPNLEDRAGWVHEYLAYTLIVLISVHALAALKHHFFNRDSTLKKMLGLNKETPS